MKLLTVSCRLLSAIYTITALNSSDKPTLTPPGFSPKDGVLDISVVSDAIEEEVSEENATIIPVFIAEVSSPLSYSDKAELGKQRVTISIVKTIRDSETELSKGEFRMERRGSKYPIIDKFIASIGFKRSLRNLAIYIQCEGLEGKFGTEKAREV